MEGLSTAFGCAGEFEERLFQGRRAGSKLSYWCVGEQPSLEEAFLELTGSSTEYQGLPNDWRDHSWKEGGS